MKNRSKTAVLSAVIFLLTAISAIPAEFTANYTETEGDRTINGHIHVTGTKFRFDLFDGDQRFRVLVNPETNQTTAIDMNKMEYRLLETDSRFSAMSDPFQAYIQASDYSDETPLGSEEISGFPCEKYQLSMNGTPVMTKWYCKELGIPLKIITHSNPEKMVLLSEIEKGLVDDALFAIPDGFKAWVDPASLPGAEPEWSGNISKAPIMDPPFDHQLKAGGTIRVKISRGKSLAVKAIDAAEGTVARVMPFKGNNPLKDETFYNNFAQKGVICTRCHEMDGEADEYVIHVYEGELTVRTKYIDMFEQILAEGEECHYIIHGNENIETRFINLTDGSAVAKYEYWKDGQPMPDDTPEKYKTIKLKNPWDIKKTARVAKGDEFVVKVTKGKMQVKLGQYDSFEF